MDNFSPYFYSKLLNMSAYIDTRSIFEPDLFKTYRITTKTEIVEE